MHINNGNDGSFDYAVRNKIKYSYSKINIGLCSSINLASKLSTHKYILYSHDDMYFCPGWEEPLVNEIKSISNSWKGLESIYKDLNVSGFLIHENGKYAKINSNLKLPAASSIKIFILILCLEMIDEGILRWDQNLKLTKDVIAGGEMAPKDVPEILRTDIS